MSREIKFRLWDGERYWYNVAPLNNEEALTQELADGECEWEYNNQYAVRKGVVEQSTGLKDENGGEIYEGDLITRCRDDDLPMVVYFGEMEDSDVSFFYLGWACDEGYSLLDYDKDCKIVGNIHENPELIGSERSR